MIGLSAIAMGYRVVVLDPDPHCPASCLAEAQIVAPYDDSQALVQLNDLCDRVTYEFENADAQAIAQAIAPDKLPQGTRALTIASHRLREKSLANALALKTPRYRPITTKADLETLTEFPIVLKTCRFGYDGKGQWLIKEPGEIGSLNLTFPGEYMAEAHVPFTQEIAVTVCRFIDDTIAFDPIETVHDHGILRHAVCPANLTPALKKEAVSAARAIIEALEYRGVLCVEFFVEGSTLYVNEIAPRPHNSAHATIEGYSHSQYDLHVLALTDAPAIEPTRLQHTYLENILGQDEPTWRRKAQTIPEAHVHLYGKHEVRMNRKMGHIVLTAPTVDALEQHIRAWRNA